MARTFEKTPLSTRQRRVLEHMRASPGRYASIALGKALGIKEIALILHSLHFRGLVRMTRVKHAYYAEVVDVQATATATTAPTKTTPAAVQPAASSRFLSGQSPGCDV